MERRSEKVDHKFVSIETVKKFERPSFGDAF